MVCASDAGPAARCALRTSHVNRLSARTALLSSVGFQGCTSLRIQSACHVGVELMPAHLTQGNHAQGKAVRRAACLAALLPPTGMPCHRVHRAQQQVGK